MERLYSQPDVFKKIMSMLPPKDITSMKLVEKKVLDFIKTEASLLHDFQALAVLIYYNKLFHELYFGNETFEIEISSIDTNRVRNGFKKFKPFEISMSRSEDEETLQVMEENMPDNLRLIIDDPKLMELVKIITKYIFDTNYGTYQLRENFHDLDLDPEESATQVYMRRQPINQIVYQLIDHGDDLHNILAQHGITPQNPLYPIIENEMLKILKKMF